MRKAHLLLLAPLLLGVALRLVGIRHGEPDMVYHPDVAKQTQVAITLFSEGELDLRRLYKDDVRFTLYPYGTAVILARTCRASATITGNDSLGDVHRWRWALRMRYQSVVLFALALAVLLPFLCRLLGLLPALAVGLLLALEPVHNCYSHYGMNDVPLLAALLPAWLFGGLMVRDKRVPLFALLSGLLIGFGFGIKYQALLGGLFPLCGCVALVLGGQWRRACIGALAVAGGIVAGALTTSPLLAGDPGYFFTRFPEFMRWQASILGEDMSLPAKLARDLPVFFGHLFGSGRWLLLPGVAWCVVHLYRAARSRTGDPVLTTLAASALAFTLVLNVSVVVSRDIVRDSDLVPSHAFGILLFGMLLAAIARREGDWPRGGKPVAVALTGLASLAFLGRAVPDSLALTRPDTRIRARDWCRENIPAGATVLRERYTLPVGKEGVLDGSFRYLVSDPVFAQIRAGGFDYLVASSLAHDRFSDPVSPYYDETAQEQYGEIESMCKTAAVFEDRQLPFAHPRITVYAKVSAE